MSYSSVDRHGRCMRCQYSGPSSRCAPHPVLALTHLRALIFVLPSPHHHRLGFGESLQQAALHVAIPPAATMRLGSSILAATSVSDLWEVLPACARTARGYSRA